MNVSLWSLSVLSDIFIADTFKNAAAKVAGWCRNIQTLLSYEGKAVNETLTGKCPQAPCVETVSETVSQLYRD